MPATRPTTIQERQEIMQLTHEGFSHASIATHLRLSVWTVRKWVRRTQSGALTSLVSALGRPARGPLSSYPPLVRYVGLRWKRQHPTWGADYIVFKMQHHAALQDQPLPDPATLWRYWRTFGTRLCPPHHAPEPKPPRTGVVHGVWQLDFKESLLVPGVGPTTITHARDAVGCATVLHRVHPALRPTQQIVKLTTAQVQADCRHAFTEWGLPDAIQTDRASLFHDDDPTPFPTRLSLWWIGLDIAHHFIPRHTPQCNGGVERSHRTLDERTLRGQRFRDATYLQAQVDADWHELNTECPSRARGCQGQPPRQAHPRLATPRRLYVPEAERQLFDLARVERYLSEFTWLRSVNPHGQLSLGSQRYGVGKAWAGQKVSIRFEPTTREFIFTVLTPAKGLAASLPGSVVRPARGLSGEEICGTIEPVALAPQQLSFPLALFDPFAAGAA